MNQDAKRRFAEFLLDEIGLVDDRYLAEAEREYRPARTFLLFRRTAVVTLTATLALGLFLSVALGTRLANKNADEAFRDEDAAIQVDSTLGNPSPSLTLRLETLRNETASRRIRDTEIDFFDGKTHIVWKYGDEETYRVRTLTDAQTDSIAKHADSQGTRIEPSENTSTIRIWILHGDGSVTTPCLSAGAGNTGYGTLFTYEPEQEPSQALSDLLCDILASN